MRDLTPFRPDRLASTFRGAATPEKARERLELLVERIDQLERGAGGRARALPREEARTFRRRVFEAAARHVQTLDEKLLAALLQGSVDQDFQVPGVLARADLHERIRALATPVYGELLDRMESADPERRLSLWWVVESLARSISFPPEVRERVYGHLHTLPREILPAFPDASAPITVIRRPQIKDFPPDQQRAIEGSAVVCALVADPALPAEYLAALVSRALHFSDPVTRLQIAEHPQADASVWKRFLRADSPVDRAIPGRVKRAWADPEIRQALVALGADDSVPERIRTAIGMQFCRAAPLEVARGWVPQVLRHGGLTALAILAYDRPELAVYAQDVDRERLRQDPEVRAVLRPSDPHTAGRDATGMAEAALADLLASPGRAFVQRLLEP